MTPTEEIEVRAIIAHIPIPQNHAEVIQRLGGLTNRVYRVGEHVLRIPGVGTEEYINRANEAASALIAAKAGVSPAVLHANAKTGIMVTAHVDAVTMSPENFKQRLGAPARAAMALHKLHRSGGEFPFRFELFAMIDDYLKLLATKTVTLPDGYHDVVREAETIRTALAKNPVPLVPCHCDPLCENFLDDGSRMWIVDWEYCGMNDPMWTWAISLSKGASPTNKTWKCYTPISMANRQSRTTPAWSSTRPCVICYGHSGASSNTPTKTPQTISWPMPSIASTAASD